MKKWIQEHLKAAAEKKIAASKEENVLLADVIEVLSLLTKFGYYDSLNDIRDLLQYLLEILKHILFYFIQFSFAGLQII